MAAPDRMDRVPSSNAEKPKVGFPPPQVHDARMKERSESLVASVILDRRNMEFIGVSGEAEGMRR
jgi:hypothetical protein